MSPKFLLYSELYIVWEKFILSLNAHLWAFSTRLFLDQVRFFYVFGLEEVIDTEWAGTRSLILFFLDDLYDVLDDRLTATEVLTSWVHDSGAGIELYLLLLPVGEVYICERDIAHQGGWVDPGQFIGPKSILLCRL